MVGRKKKIPTYEILKKVREGKYPSLIAKELSVSHVAILKRLKELEEKGLVKKIKSYPTFYELTPKGQIFLNRLEKEESNQSSLPVNEPKPALKETIRFHDFKVKIPIIREGYIPKEELDEKGKIVYLNNWAKRYLYLDTPFPITIEVTTKNVILHFHAHEFKRDLNFFTEFLQWLLRGFMIANFYLHQRGFTLDWFNLEVISQHIATQVHDKIDEKIPEGTKIEVGLGRKAESITQMNQEAKAWIDKSEGQAEIETNDLLYEEKLLLMPEKVFDIDEELKKLAEKYNLTQAELEHIKKDILEIAKKSMLYTKQLAEFAAAHTALIIEIKNYFRMLNNSYYNNIINRPKQNLINITGILKLIWRKIAGLGKYLLRLIYPKG